MLRLEETRKFFKSEPRAGITAGRSCPKALLLYIIQQAKGEAAALQTSKQCPGPLDCWPPSLISGGKAEHPQKPDSAGFKYTNRTAGDYLSPQDIPGSLVTVELPHPLSVLQQACGFLRPGFGDLESSPCSSCFLQWERTPSSLSCCRA